MLAGRVVHQYIEGKKDEACRNVGQEHFDGVDKSGVTQHARIGMEGPEHDELHDHDDDILHPERRDKIRPKRVMERTAGNPGTQPKRDAT